jgi:sodium/bile acid cotransporter 7
MLKRLPTIPFDAFLLALGATVALAALFPAHGDAA